MMKAPSFVLTVIGFLLSFNICWSQSSREKQTFLLHPNSKVEYNADYPHYLSLFGIKEGEDLVFEYTSNNAAEEGNDSEAETKVAFQVKPDAKSFKWIDQEIAEHAAVYVQLCRCADAAVHPIDEGVIEGKKRKDGTWEVEMSVYLEGHFTGKRYHIQADGVFVSAEK